MSENEPSNLPRSEPASYLDWLQDRDRNPYRKRPKDIEDEKEQ